MFVTTQQRPSPVDPETRRLGLVALSTDIAVEREFHRMADSAGVEIVTGRIPCCVHPTVEGLAEMRDELRSAVGLIAENAALDVVVFACTSGSMLIGPGRVAEEVASVRPGVPCAMPGTAVVEALKAIGARRIAVVTPYPDDVNRAVAAFLTEAGLELAGLARIPTLGDVEIARIAPRAVIEAARAVLDPNCDAVLVSCTGFNIVTDIVALEAELGVPVITSNQAAFWRAMEMMGRPSGELTRFGSLFAVSPA